MVHIEWTELIDTIYFLFMSRRSLLSIFLFHSILHCSLLSPLLLCLFLLRVLYISAQTTNKIFQINIFNS